MDKQKKQTKFWMYLIGAAVIAAAIYLVGWFYFSSHYYPKAKIGQYPVGWKTEAQATRELQEHYDNYDLTLNGYASRTQAVGGTSENSADETIAFHLNQLNLEYEGDEYTFESGTLMNSQKPYFWPAYVFRSFHSTAKVHMDEKDIMDKISSLECFQDWESSRNARILWKENQYVIIPETYGTEIEESTKDKILAAVKEGTDVFDLSPYYIDPEIRKDDETLLSHFEEMQEMIGLDLYYQFGEKKETISPEEIAGMILEEEDGVTVDEDRVRAFIKELSDEYDTAYSPHTFTTHAGNTITIANGDYGWWTDVSSSAETLKEAIEKKQSGEQKFTYFYTAASYGERDYGDTYVEVSLGSQSLWYYKDGEEILSCSIISGNVSAGHGTPTGIYRITYKENGHQMVGEDYDVWTDYWMPFNGNVGLHDASWRSRFGGNLYLRNGSHGCVNMPVWAARTLFGYVQKGTPVIVY